MNVKNKLFKSMLLILGIAIVAISCQKMDRPSLTDYPKDTNPPGGPLKFYLALDGTEVDSIRGNFGLGTNEAFEAGISGQGYMGTTSSYIRYASANDFDKVTSFTISFWMKKDGPPARDSSTQWIFGLATTADLWHKHELGLFFENAGNPSSPDSAAVKLIIQDQFIEFIGAKRLPNVLNNEWHHLALVYDQATSKLLTYVDGVVQYPNDPSVTDIKKAGSPRGALSFTKVGGFVLGGPGHHAISATPDAWMGNFSGQLDQFRMYNNPFTAAEVAALFSGKQ